MKRNALKQEVIPIERCVYTGFKNLHLSGDWSQVAMKTGNPFGMMMPERDYTSGSYRYGYQGSEKDDEIIGEGNLYTTYFRELDTRLGRWWSLDPKASAEWSPYASMSANPIWFNDPLGDTVEYNSIRDRIKIGINRIKSKEFNENFKILKGSECLSPLISWSKITF